VCSGVCSSINARSRSPTIRHTSASVTARPNQNANHLIQVRTNLCGPINRKIAVTTATEIVPTDRLMTGPPNNSIARASDRPATSSSRADHEMRNATVTGTNNHEPTIPSAGRSTIGVRSLIVAEA